MEEEKKRVEFHARFHENPLLPISASSPPISRLDHLRAPLPIPPPHFNGSRPSGPGIIFVEPGPVFPGTQRDGKIEEDTKKVLKCPSRIPPVVFLLPLPLLTGPPSPLSSVSFIHVPWHRNVRTSSVGWRENGELEKKKSSEYDFPPLI